MSLIESVRDLVKGLVAAEPDVGEHDTDPVPYADAADTSPAATVATPATAADDALGAVADTDPDNEVERMRREWESEPSHH
jgi:hypothetical protein